MLNIALTLGPAKSSGFGLQPIDASDIKAYCDLFKQDLTIWEVEQVLGMAKSFVNAHQEYDGENCAPPTSIESREHAADVSKRLKDMLIKRSQSNKRSAPIGGRDEQ